jgi:protein phosphatase
MVLHAMPAYQEIAYGLSDVGLVRANNEDAWVALPSCHLYALADGMGGHRAGEVAAKAAIDNLSKLFPEEVKAIASDASPSQLCKMMHDVICDLNNQVYRLSCSSPTLQGMGTTLCVLYLHGRFAILAHVGDSRIYRLRDGKLLQMTRDHSLLLDMTAMWEGQAEKVASRSKYRSVITRAIGTESSVDPSVYASDLHIGDTFLLCSDGLSDLISQDELELLLSHDGTMQERAEMLILAAKKKGGHDNITVVIIDVVKEI